MLETTDTLLKGLAEGNQNRWARFYRDYAPLIERTLTNRGISHADAEEAIQDTLLELVKIMPTYKYDKARKGAFHSLLFNRPEQGYRPDAESQGRCGQNRQVLRRTSNAVRRGLAT